MWLWKKARKENKRLGKGDTQMLVGGARLRKDAEAVCLLALLIPKLSFPNPLASTRVLGSLHWGPFPRGGSLPGLLGNHLAE